MKPNMLILMKLLKAWHNKILFFLFYCILFTISINSYSQTTLLSPTGDGGFETGATLAANGWTVVDGTSVTWFVGTAAGAQGGTNAAFVGTNSTTYVGSSASVVKHFYRDIAIPAGATQVYLNYYLKMPIIDNTYDYFYIYINNTSQTPVVGSLPAGTQKVAYTTPALSGFSAQPQIDLTSYAGSTIRLVFTYKTDAVSPYANPAVDNISLTYVPSCTAPTTQATTFTYSSVQATTMTLGWTRGNGNNVMIIAKSGSAPTDPVSGTTYTADAAYGSGTAVGGGFCVYNGSGTSVNLTNLSANTTYHFAAYEYNTTGTCYNLTELVGNNSTLCSEPTTQASAVTFSSITTTGMTINWSRGGTPGDGVIVVLKSGSAPSNPSDGTTYTANTAFGSGTDVGSNSYVVNLASGTSVAVTGLSANTTYYANVYEKNCTGATSNYRTTTPASGSATTLCSEPTTQASSVTFSSITETSMTVNWTRGGTPGDGVIVVAKSGSAPTDPGDGTTYTANAAFGTGTDVGSSSYVVYMGAGTSVNVTGLTAGTTYYFEVFEKNCTGSTSNFYTTSPASGNQMTRDYLFTVGSGQDYSTIQAALTAVYSSWGTTSFDADVEVRVYNGTYTEALTTNSGLAPNASGRLLIKAASGNYPIIDGASSRARGFDITESYVTISGFEIRNHTADGIKIAGGNNIVTENIVHDNSAYGILLFGGGNNNEISYNKVYNTTSGAGIKIISSSSGNIHHNLSYNNGTHGIQVGETGFSADNCTVKNNTCYSNGSSSSGTTTLLSPTGDGGFETNTTFATNGWTSVNSAGNYWILGNLAPAYAGSRGAHISQTGASYNYSLTSAYTSHFYRDIAIPAGATNISLSFYWKGSGESGWDRLLVYTAPTSVTPVVNVPASNSTTITSATLVWTQPSYAQGTYVQGTYTVPNGLAGTTVRFIFTWQNDGSAGTSPGAAIDNISLTCTPAPTYTGSGIYVEAGTTALLNNNICYAKTGTGDQYYAMKSLVAISSSSGNNLFYKNGNTYFINHNSTSYNDIAVWNATAQGNSDLDSDPLFVTNGSDFHEKSTSGSYHSGSWPPTTASGGTWVNDASDSPCLDAGNNDSYANEPSYNGCKINLGCYGNTAQASKSVPNNTSKAEASATPIAAGNIPSTATALGSAVSVFAFKITDLGTASCDGLATKVTAIKIKKAAGTADWSDHIAGAGIFYGGSEVANTGVTVTDNDITISFDPAVAQVANNSSAELVLKIWLNSSNIVDNSTMQFTISQTTHGFTSDASGSGFATDFGAAITSNVMTVRVSATQFVVTTQPSATVCVNTNLGTQTVIVARDANGNNDIDYSSNITVSNSQGYGMSNSPTSISSGSLTFPANFQFTTGGGSATITVAENPSAGITDATTNSITVSSASVGGTISGGGAVCYNSTSGTLSLSGHTGSVTKWQSSTDNFVSNIVDIANTSTNYESGALTSAISYRAVVTSGVCNSANSATASITINPLPTITLGSNPVVCSGTTSSSISYSATTNSPDNYNIDYDNTANLAGFTDLSLQSLPVSPIPLTIPGGAASATYNANITVTNTTTGCTSTNNAITVTINSLPSITGQPANASAEAGSGVANFTVTATGTGIAYQWQEYITSWNNVSDGGVYSGATTGTLTITNPPIGMNSYKYRCVVTGTCSPSATSDGNATLTVTITPAIALSSSNPSVAAANIAKSTLKNIIYNFTQAVTVANASLTSVVFTTSGGTYTASDVTKFQLWYNTSNDFSTSTQLGTDITTSLGNGAHTFNGFTQAINSGTTGYFWITTDIPSGATAGRTIIVSAITTANLTYTAANKSGTAYASGTQTITAELLVPATGSNSYTTCSANLYDHAGSGGTYAINSNGYTVLYPTAGNLIQVSGTSAGEACCDYVAIYDGAGTGGTLRGTYNMGTAIPSITSNDPNGVLTVKFYSDVSTNGNGFNITVACVACSAPSTQASNVSYSNVGSTSATVSWTRGNGTNCAVFMAATSSGNAAPVDGTTYNANSVFGSGSQIGSSGWYCIYKGTGTSVGVTNLSGGTTYRVHVIEYTCSNYNTSTAANNPANQATLTPLCGDYHIGTGKTYTTIGAAISDLNLKGVSCATTFYLDDATYPSESYPITINAISGASLTNYVKIMPNTGVTTTISGSSTSSIIKLNGVDYFTIEGSNLGTTSKDLNIINTNTSSSTSAIWIASLGTNSGATYNTIKNCNIKAGSKTSTTYGIFIGGTSIGTSGDDNDYNSIQSNSISKAYYGIYASASASGSHNNLTLQSNNVGSSTSGDEIGFNGIYLYYCTESSISQNTVFNITNTSSIEAVNISTGVSNTTFNGNIIKEITNNGTNRASGFYVGASAGANLTFSNNMIYGIISNGTGGNTYACAGFYINSGTTYNFYNNSINLYGDRDAVSTTKPTSISACIYIGTGSVLNIKNNIFVNLQTATSNSPKSYAIYSAVANTAYSSINYNNYFVTGSQGVLGYLTSDQATIGAWRTATAQDVNSININPEFYSNTNLHLSNISINAAGTPIGSITTDIDGEARDASTPDIGADEFTPSNLDAAITTLIAPTAPFCAGSNNIQVTIKNNGLSTLTSLTVNWTVNGVSQTPYDWTGSITTGNSTNVTLGSFIFVTGTSYTIVATSSAPNSGTDGNTNNDSYTSSTLLPAFSGSIHVGAGKTYSTISSAIAALNTAGVCGATTFYLDDETYSESPVSISPINGASATNTITIKPNSGSTPEITFNATVNYDYGFLLNGCDYIIFDGSNSSGGTSKDLKIIMAGYESSVFYLLDGSTNNIIKNCEMVGFSNSSYGDFGVYADGLNVDNNTITNNKIYKVETGINFYGDATTYNTGNIVSNNIIGSSNATEYITDNGCYFYYQTNLSLSGNEIFNVQASYKTYGVYLTSCTSVTVEKNSIHDIIYTGTLGDGGVGIYVSSSATNPAITIRNNFIYSLAGDGETVSWVSEIPCGIYLTGSFTTGVNILNNSIYLTRNTSYGLNYSSTDVACGVVVSSGSGITMKNNIIQNDLGEKTGASITSKGYMIICKTATSPFSAINYNRYYFSGVFDGTSTGYGNSADQGTLLTWQTWTGQEANSAYLGASIFTSATNLHSTSFINGEYIASITDDFDGETRPGSPNPPDIGADESSSPPTITNVSPTSIYKDRGKRLTITGTNLSTATTVTYGGISASIVSKTTTQIIADVPAGNYASTTLAVTTNGGSANNTSVTNSTRTTIPVNISGSGDDHLSITSAVDGLYAWMGATAFTSAITIEIAAGTYSESVTPNTLLNPQAANKLIITNKTGETPIINAAGRTNGINITDIDNVIVKGLTITSATSDNIYCKGNNNVISFNKSYSSTGGSGIKIENATTSNDSIHHNLVYKNKIHGIHIKNSNSTKVINNTAYGNGDASESTGSFTTSTWTSGPSSITDDACGITDLNAVINVASSYTITEVEVYNVSITHTFDGDLNIYLKSPSGTLVPLCLKRGSAGDNFSNTCFDDGAASAISSGSAPFTNTYRPESPLSAFAGQNTSGNWTLVICDDAIADVGTLNNGWYLKFYYSSLGSPVGAGIYVESGTNTSIRNNNLVAKNSTGDNYYALHSLVNIENTSSYNNFEENGNSYFIKHNGTSYNNIATWNSAGFGNNNISDDPEFVNTSSGTEDFHEQTTMTNGTYASGNWPPNSASGGTWTTYLIASTCVDAGNPADSYSNEPLANGSRINLGCYGNTAQATKGGCQVAAAGDDQFICTSGATLAATAAGPGFTGTWTGTGVSFSNANSNTSTVSGLAVGTNTLTWTITNGSGCSMSDDVDITVYANPSAANAGADQSTCNTTATMAGNTPATGSGQWSLISGTGSVTEPNNPTSGVTGLGDGANVFAWTTSNGTCATSSDQVTITKNAIPAAPTTTDDDRCGTGTVNLSSTAGSGGTTCYWYDAQINGNLINTGLTYTTPSLSSTTVYWVATYNATTTCISTDLTSVTATINPVPDAPSTADGSRVGTGTVNLSATAGTNGTTCSWYSSSLGGSPITGGSPDPGQNTLTWTTPSITETTSYYVSTVNATTGCESNDRTAVMAYIVPPASGVLNNGIVIRIESDCNLYIDGGSTGDYTCRTVYGSHGTLRMNGNIYLEGDWDNDDETGDGFTSIGSPYGKVVFIGTEATQSVNGAIATNFEDFVIDKSSGKVSINITDLSVENNLTLTNGALDLNGNKFIIKNGATNAISRTNGYILSNSLDLDFDSKVQWNIGANSGAHVFPFGIDASNYVPFTFNLEAGGDCGDLIISTYNAVGGTAQAIYDNKPTLVNNLNGIYTGSTPPANAEYIVQRFWLIEPGNNPIPAGKTATLTFTYADSEVPFVGEIVGDEMIAQRYSSTSNTWQPEIAGQTSDLATNTVSNVVSSQFSIWAATKKAKPLPVSLNNFFAKCNFSKTIIYWSTLSEINCSHFEIEKSYNSHDFELIGTINGHGNSNISNQYQLSDNYTEDINKYYRLKIVDFDGKFKYSDIISVNCSGNNNDIEVINVKPEANNLLLEIASSNECKINISLYNDISQLVYNNSIQLNNGKNIIKVENKKLSKGIYYLQIRNEFGIISKKILIN